MTTQRNWINVKDKLPEPRTDVLIFCPSWGQAVARYDPEWNDWYWNDITSDIVTHWQPLQLNPEAEIK